MNRVTHLTAYNAAVNRAYLKHPPATYIETLETKYLCHNKSGRNTCWFGWVQNFPKSAKQLGLIFKSHMVDTPLTDSEKCA